MNRENRIGSLRRFAFLLPLLACLGFMAPGLTASAQSYHHRHRVVRIMRVRRHGHWVTIRRTVWR